jgi:hypothetical protein
LSQSNRREGHLLLHSGLVIGHKEKDGVQRVLSDPFTSQMGRGKAQKRRKAPHRQDLVFVRPPDAAKGGFQLTMDSVWFCKVLLLFSFKTRTDSGIKEHKCAFVSVLWDYQGDRRPGSNFI